MVAVMERQEIKGKEHEQILERSPQSIWRRGPGWSGTMPITPSGLGLSANPCAGKEVITSRYAQPPPQGFRT